MQIYSRIIKGSERSVRYKKNTLYMFLLKFISMAISFVYVPLMLNALDTERYGIWLTLTSIVSWIAMLDIGLGNGLRNKLSESLAKKNLVLARKYVSSAYVSLTIYMTVFLLLFTILGLTVVPWNEVLNAQSVPEDELSALVIIVFVSFGAHFVLNLLNSIFYGLQMPATSNFISTLGQFASLLFVLICVHLLKIKSLLILGTIVSIVPVIVVVISSIVVFGGKYKYLRPSMQYYDKNLIKEILGLGINFFFIQMMTIFIYQSNNLIIAHIIGNEGVVEYNVANKYVQIIHILYMIIVTPLWSATTNAYFQGDIKWIVNIKNKLNKISCLLALIGALMCLVSPIFYKYWLNNDTVSIAFSSTLILLLSEIFRMFYGNYGYIINGIGKLRAQLIISIIIGSLYIPTAICLGEYFSLEGILIAGLLVNVINSIWSRYQFNIIIQNRPSKFWNR